MDIYLIKTDEQKINKKKSFDLRFHLSSVSTSLCRVLSRFSSQSRQGPLFRFHVESVSGGPEHSERGSGGDVYQYFIW